MENSQTKEKMYLTKRKTYIKETEDIQYSKKLRLVKYYWTTVVVVGQSLSQLLRPQGLQPTRLLCPWDFPGKNSGVGCHFLLQAIFPTQESNPDLLHCRRILYQLGYEGSHLLLNYKVKKKKERMILDPAEHPGENVEIFIRQVRELEFYLFNHWFSFK